jgi:hypothetical protein
MTHTSGPWHRNIKPASHYPVIFAGRNTHVARVIDQGLPEAEIEANCNLIAAAPELLAAAKDMLNTMESPRTRKASDAWDALRAAIAKVERDD